MMRLPVIPTIIVLAAVGIMIALGIWQLGRADEKEAMIARYSQVASNGDPVAYPTSTGGQDEYLYRPTMAECARVQGIRGTAGTNERGRKGWAFVAACGLPQGGAFEVALGWSAEATPPGWSGGTVMGILAPGGKIVADPPLAGLDALAKPDPKDLPNNHLAYAGQWFFFALTALVIYWLAIRRRSHSKD